MSSQLHSLRQYTTVVADTGDFESLRRYQPTDATTNPSLILKAVQKPENAALVQKVIADHKHATSAQLLDHLLVAFGCEILNIIPGRVSTEVDARLSFDTQASVERARQIIGMYERAGVERERVLIKLASTWEGIQAARQLQADGIRCNMTLLFSLPQALACAQARVQLISPFVGRIYDWHKKAAGAQWNEQQSSGIADPGVQSVTRIYNYYKAYDIATEIMGASFRNVGQIIALAGCDLLTISPELLAQLESTAVPVERRLDPDIAREQAPEWLASNEITFRTELNQDAMATEKLAEGIRAFAADGMKLDAIIQQVKENLGAK